MPYQIEQVGEREIDDVYIDEDGKLRTFVRNMPVHLTLWSTPWQPEHIPIGSVIAYQATSMEEIVATITGHARQPGRRWCFVTDIPCPAMNDGSFKVVSRGWIKRVISRGSGGIRWQQNQHHLGKVKEQCVTSPHKRKQDYYATDLTSLVQRLIYTHPAFSYVQQDNHLYDEVYELAQRLSRIPGLMSHYHEGSYVDINSMGLSHYALSLQVTVNKEKFKAALHRVLRYSRSSRLKAEKEYDREMNRLYEEQYDHMIEIGLED